KLFFVHNKIPVSECIISETGIYTNCGRGSKIPSCSKLHTKISLTHKNRDVVSKNTIKKYLSQ
ncbi:hypothetical protein, partial [Glaesserella parasuis]|uniref:hypothetical protein n=1 Tax=Glaesserella parasuis TaxID=738 RepID=UPI001BE40579